MVLFQYFRFLQSVPLADSDPNAANAITSAVERMEATAKTQRRRARRKPAGSSVICIQMKDGPNRVTADVVDVIDRGYGVSLRIPLKAGSTVVVGEHIEAEVRWCVQKPDGTFRAVVGTSAIPLPAGLLSATTLLVVVIAKVRRLEGSAGSAALRRAA